VIIVISFMELIYVIGEKEPALAVLVPDFRERI
jgi:hypothetical protein